jgi:Glycoside hydrolase family 44/Bacterial Ig-like domain (group 2)
MRYTIAGVSGALVCALIAGCGGGGGTQQQPTVTAVSVSLSTTSINTGQTTQATATVTGTGSYSSAVNWSINPTSAGSISSTGLFTPSAAGNVSIIATSVEDSSISGNAALTVTQGPKIVISAPSTSVVVGGSLQLTATVSGETNTSVTWEISGPSGWTGDIGTISSTGLYQSPYPAPASVTITATSAADTTLTASTTLTLTAPATASGPILTVDAGRQLHAISPLIYGMNAYVLDTTSAQTANVSITRWGGDNTSQYNYQTGNSNSAGDYYFENGAGAGGMLPNPNGSSQFTAYVSAANALPATVLGSMNVMGYVANSSTTACGFPESSFPNQVSYVTLGSNSCGDGYYQVGTNGCSTSSGSYDSGVGGCSFSGSATTWQNTSLQEPPPSAPGAGNNTAAWAKSTWPGGWVSSIVNASGFGTGASGKGVAIWDMDNEPAWWDAVHRDVHPNPSTYDEVTNGGIGTAVAIKTVDPTALVSGPIIDYWWNYFYSKADIESGWGTGSATVCQYQPWSNPTDRKAHNGVAMIPYYLEQMNKASSAYGMRLLDYVDIHGYFAGSAAFTTAGDTSLQAARMDSVRALWDPTWQNSNYPQPNYFADSGYYDQSACAVPLQSPQAVLMLHQWVNGVGLAGDPNNNYPGTRTAIDEYNFGGLESINGAVTQADVLGIFGQYGLDLATLWPTTNYNTQGPGNYAFAIYRNYDGAKSAFGDTALASCSTSTVLTAACLPLSTTTWAANPAVENGQAQLSVYGALRSKDNAITIVVINKTYGTLTSTINLLNAPSVGTTASVYQYSNANLTAIVSQPGVTVTPASGGAPAMIASYPFPAQSVTLFVIPQ